MRSPRLGALVLLCLVPAPSAAATPPPTETDVVLRGVPTAADGRGVVKVRTRVPGDVRQCEGLLRLKVKDLASGELVLDQSKPVSKVARFGVDLEDGAYRVVGSYELGDRDPCVESRGTERLVVTSADES